MQLAEQYAAVNLYLLGNLNSDSIFAYLQQKINVINELCAKILIGMNILRLEGVILDLHKGKIMLLNCKGTEIDLLIIAKDNICI